MRFYSSPVRIRGEKFKSQYPTQFGELMKLTGFEEAASTENDNLTCRDCWTQKNLAVGVFHWGWDTGKDLEDLFDWLKAENKKIIWVAHEVDVASIGLTDEIVKKKKRNRELMTQNADQVIALNLNDFKKLSAICKGKVHSCTYYSLGTQVGDYDGLDKHTPFEELSYEKKTFCFYGSLQPHKGVVELVKAWLSLKKHYPDWKLKIYAKSFGKYPEADKLLKNSQDKQLVWIEEGYTRLEDCLGEFAIFPYKSCNNSKLVEEVVICGNPIFSTTLQAFVGKAVFMHIDLRAVIGQGIAMLSGDRASRIKEAVFNKRTMHYKKDQKAKSRLINLLSTILLGERVVKTSNMIDDMVASQQAEIERKRLAGKQQAAQAREAAANAVKEINKMK